MTGLRKKKIFIEAGVAIFLALILIIPVTAQNVNIMKDDNGALTMTMKPINDPIRMGGPIYLEKEKLLMKEYTFDKNPMLINSDVNIFDSPDLILQNPTIAHADNSDNVLALVEFHESIVDSNIGFIESLDGGQTWSDSLLYFQLDGYVELPDVDYVGNINGKDAFRGAAIDASGTNSVFLLPDVTDIETIEGYSVVWSDNGFYDFTSCDIVCHNDLIGAGEDYYIVAYIASFSDLPPYDDQVQIPHYMVDSGGGGVMCLWFYYTDSSNSKIDIDKSSEVVYYAFQYKNETNEDIILLSSPLEFVGEVEPGGWGDGLGEGRKYQITGSVDAINPAIAAEKDHVYLIMETNSGGNQDLVCYYSNDGGETYSMSVVADSSDDEVFPEVYADGETAVCVFTKNNNLYAATTEDGGLTWAISDAINDVDGSVVEKISNADVYGGKTIWTDDRAENYAVYVDDAVIVEKAAYSIESVSGGFGASAVIKNVGNAPGTFDWSIDIKGTVFFGGQASGTETLQVGETVTVKSGIALGLGTVAIIVKADTVTKSSQGTLLLFYILGVS